MKLIVTRPLGQAAPWVTRLQALGVEAQVLPLLRIDPLEDTAPLRDAWARLSTYTMVFFASANAVQYFFAAAPSAGQAPPLGHWPAGVWAGSPGPGTTAALRSACVPATQLVEPDPAAGQFDSEALWLELQFRSWAGRCVLVVRGEEGRDWLADALRSRGAEVKFIAAYRRRPPRLDATGVQTLVDALTQPEQHLWHFSSSEGVGYLLALGQRLTPPADWSRSRAVASHPRIAQRARDSGFGQVHEVGANVQAVVDWLADPAASRKKTRLP